MHQSTFVRNRGLRAIAFILLAVTSWLMVTPESGDYSVGKTFIKSHSPATNNFAPVISSDDKEDTDEDGAMDLQLSPYFSIALLPWATLARSSKINLRPVSKMNDHQVYLFHRQLLI